MFKLRALLEVLGQIDSGDLLLFRPSRWNLLGRLIAIAGRGEYCHAGMAEWRYVGLRCLEMVARGGRDVSLERLVKSQPGRIDVYEANPDNRWPGFRPSNAVLVMRGLIQRQYGFWNLLRVACRHLFIIRLFMRPETNDQIEGGAAPYCSHAIAFSDRKAGGDPVPQLSDRMTEPADLARSPFYRYRFTLIPGNTRGEEPQGGIWP